MVDKYKEMVDKYKGSFIKSDNILPVESKKMKVERTSKERKPDEKTPKEGVSPIYRIDIVNNLFEDATHESEVFIEGRASYKDIYGNVLFPPLIQYGIWFPGATMTFNLIQCDQLVTYAWAVFYGDNSYDTSGDQPGNPGCHDVYTISWRQE